MKNTKKQKSFYEQLWPALYGMAGLIILIWGAYTTLTYLQTDTVIGKIQNVQIRENTDNTLSTQIDISYEHGQKKYQEAIKKTFDTGNRLDAESFANKYGVNGEITLHVYKNNPEKFTDIALPREGWGPIMVILGLIITYAGFGTLFNIQNTFANKTIFYIIHGIKLVLGLLFVGYGVYWIYTGIISNRFVPIEATITGSTVEVQQRWQLTRYFTDEYFTKVMYEYEVEGKKYEGTNTGFYNFSSSRMIAGDEAARYPVGNTITVYYDPMKAERSIFDLQKDFLSYSVITGLGIFLLWLFYKRISAKDPENQPYF